MASNSAEDEDMIAAFTCAALFLLIASIVGAIRMGLLSIRRKWHGGHHTDRYVAGCNSCWLDLSQDERHARIRANLDATQERERAEARRERYRREMEYIHHS